MSKALHINEREHAFISKPAFVPNFLQATENLWNSQSNSLTILELWRRSLPS